jgi:hypothetical protein
VQKLPRFLRETLLSPASAFSIEEQLRQQVDVAAAVAQRGSSTGITDKRYSSRCAGCPPSPLRPAAVGRADDAHLELDFLVAADAAEAARLEHAQQLDLHVEGISVTSSEEQRAAVGALEAAFAQAAPRR